MAPVVPISNSGYGTSTIRDLVAYEFGDSVDLVFAPRLPGSRQGQPVIDRHSQAAHGCHPHAVRHLVTGGVLEHNPALSVKAPRQKLGKGKTPMLTAEEAGDPLRSIENDTVVGLRDRALIGVMVFTFARVSAACGLNVADIFHQQRRQLNGERLNRINSWAMVRRRAKAAGITTQVCNHSFRGTGVTAYLENGGTLEKARQMAAHASIASRLMRS